MCLRWNLKCLILLLIGTLSGCMVGPNFHSPRPPEVLSYTETPLSCETVSTPQAGQAGKAQRFIPEACIPHDWWRLFHNRALNELIIAGLENSPTVGTAEANLREATETYRAEIGLLLIPAVDAQFTANRQKIAGLSFGIFTPARTFNLYNVSVDVTYMLDVWGGNRRQVEYYQAQTNYQQYEFMAAYLTLTSNIVTTAIEIASTQAQIQATQELIDLEANQLKIIKGQFGLGGVSLQSVLSQQTLLEQTRGTLPPLEKTLSMSRHALSVLVGQFPDEPLPCVDLDELILPRDIPLSVPSCLVRQRPDILAAEALLHAASAQIGVATGNLFPEINLTGKYGSLALTLGELFNPETTQWMLAAQVLQKVFRGGALLAQRRAAIAGYQAAGTQYEEVVLQAFKEVADALRALETDAERLQALERAEVAAKKNVSLIESQYKLGGVNYLAIIIADQQYHQAKLSRIQAQASRYTDTAALFQAMGGGWWSPPCP